MVVSYGDIKEVVQPFRPVRVMPSMKRLCATRKRDDLGKCDHQGRCDERPIIIAGLGGTEEQTKRRRPFRYGR
jgi:hypothetical protein